MHEEFDRIIYDEDVMLDRIRVGDKQTYRLLFENYYKVLILYASSLTKNETKAEDLAQNAFINLWTKRDTLEIRTSVKSYLYKSVYNLFINDYRKELRNNNVLDKIHYEVLLQSLEEEEQSIKIKLDWVNKEIDSLPPKSKEIFIMNKRRGLTYKEISKILDISENTVESHISRALKRIRQNIPKSLLFLLFSVPSSFKTGPKS
ncbi:MULTISPECIES: RNA polymerase sigma factor [unclassified Arenibacter]|jgi:RNA polymerase sigma-70 factor (ECF subfamily)|uniref:RNA polymerase sigma factor n=1 Tax=unclassified Arenibacter TaxID=2615047 RepID=UPI000E340E72|nr:MULTISPECIES: RNA polymerase sigma-70 factor [unclassified Arenibacter]MCM4163013.1 RNA polymerase sigma-70 factor [Arenibacter sp. A80]RFT57052.1 RNA polymerase sigma-70 factor [Arenibacter sp. P308M17]